MRPQWAPQVFEPLDINEKSMTLNMMGPRATGVDEQIWIRKYPEPKI